ncbi:MAG: hypothetical protein OEW12_06930 [Deltaproteobacteria bacterium]|nr:hypothetical protein [Deltaproteobacteria bacterium]
MLFLLLPWFDLRMIALGFFVLGLFTVLEQGICLTRNGVTSILAGAYGLNYLLVPMWEGSRFPALALVLLLLGYMALAAVSHRFAGPLTLKLDPGSRWLALTLYVLFLAIQFLPFHNSITYLGDSIPHMSNTGWHGAYLKPPLVLGFAGAGGAFLVAFAYRGRLGYVWAAAIAFLLAAATHMQVSGGDIHALFRYPSLSYFVSLPFSIPALSAVHYGWTFDEANFRILSFLSFLAMGIMAALRFQASWPARYALGIVVLSIPFVLYHATLTYIDFPLFVLMLAVIFGFREQLSRLNQQNGGLGWSVVVLGIGVGFKETSVIYAIIFLSVFFVCGYGYGRKKGWKNWLVPWGGSVVVIGLLLVMFVWLRDWHARGYTPQISWLWMWEAHRDMLRSVWDFIGILPVLSFLGLGILFWKKQWGEGLLVFAMVIGCYLFFLMDAWRAMPRMVNYMLPGMIAGLVLGLNAMPRWRNGLVLGAAPLLILWNVWHTPMDMWTATRTPGVGNYHVNTQEYDAPYDAFYHWLAAQPPVQKLCVVGRDFGYYDWFYFQKYNLNPTRFEVPIGLIPTGFFDRPFDVCVQHQNTHLGDGIIPFPKGYSQTATFTKGAIQLVVYRHDSK